MGVTAIQTKSAPLPKGNYSQAVRIGDLLFISGQLPLDSGGRLVSRTVAAQAQQALSNIRAILEAAGGTIAHLVQCTMTSLTGRKWTRSTEPSWLAYLCFRHVLWSPSKKCTTEPT